MTEAHGMTIENIVRCPLFNGIGRVLELKTLRIGRNRQAQRTKQYIDSFRFKHAVRIDERLLLGYFPLARPLRRAFLRTASESADDFHG
jgi:hypothetical protein